MECNKCHKLVPENATVCPHCKKVLALECPNCHSVQHSPVCDSCGYIILEKCTKCGKLVPTTNVKCKCGYPVKSSIAYNECENDEFAAMTIRFAALKNIRNLLGSYSLYKKFQTKLNNMLLSQINGIEGKIIISRNDYIINFNKELSLSTSANKAIRLGLKILNAFSEINLKVIQELGTSLKLTINIQKKLAEDLLENRIEDNNVKLLAIKKEEKKYLNGMQIILDQYIQDSISKEYKTDSLYALEHDGSSIMYYEVVLGNYILPPTEESNDNAPAIPVNKIKKIVNNQEQEEDLYGFNVFDIKAKCKFEKSNAIDVIQKLDSNKIIAIKADEKLLPSTSEIMNYFDRQGIKVLHGVCTDLISSKPWGMLELLFKEFYNLSEHKSLIDENFDVKIFTHLKNLLFEKRRKAGTAEDARFAYIEDFCNFLASLKNCVVYIENFEKIDDTTIQTLELYFDKYKNINVNFVFSTTGISVHSKIKELLRTEYYTEYELKKSGIEELVSNIKEDASDFIKSFYFEKIQENYKGSKLYFDNAIKYIEDKGILLSFEDKLIIKNNNSVVLPPDFEELLKSRIKHYARNMDMSFVIAYSNYFGPRMDFKMLAKLGIKNPEKTGEDILKAGFGFVKDDTIYMNNYGILHKVVQASLKPQVEEILIKNILSALGEGLDTSLMLMIMNKLEMHKDEYLTAWKNSQFAMLVGDYDAYLKNCLRFLSIIEKFNEQIPKEEVEACKMEVFQNILMSLYSYSPTKIYSIENILLMEAINNDNEEQIVKLSNLMLQGALVSSNYTDALTLLHNILKRMEEPSLIIDNSVNKKFLLLSLVNIEILFNIGEFTKCIETAEDLLSVISPNNIDSIKPDSFSSNKFIEHLQETYRLVCFAKIIRGDLDLAEYLDKLNNTFGKAFPDKECIIAVKEFLSGKDYVPSNVENATAFSKMIYLILQEFTLHSGDYKSFAQNIYQAKLLANDLHQIQVEKLCELLIANSYMNIGIKKKAEYIYNDILQMSEKSAIFTINLLAQYFIARKKIADKDIQGALYIINDALAIIQKRNNDAKLLYVIFEKLFVDVVSENNIESVDINSEKNNLFSASSNNEFARIVGRINVEESFDN